MAPRQVLIALTAQHNSEHENEYFLRRAYIDAIVGAGGIPLILPPLAAGKIETVLDRVQGLVLTGGVDVDPRRYGEQPSEKCGEISPLRDELDLAAAAAALKRDLPLLAICRGIQVLNVALGGSLLQHIPEEVEGALKHRQQAPGWYGTHEVQVEPDTLLAEAVGSGPLVVNSLHHQAVKRLGEGLLVSAVAPDGVVEAVESRRHRFAVGVQWHPELMVEHCPAARAVFAHFLRAAAGTLGD